MWLLLLLIVASSAEPLVETDLGAYRGYEGTSFGGRTFYAFSGIRYAKKVERFELAKAVGKHEGIMDATEEGNDCIQTNRNLNKYPYSSSTHPVVGKEDCLFLNIYTPELNRSSSLPVLVYLHPGGFFIGTGSASIHGPELLMDRNIVLVTLNYRLDVFGFVSLENVPANLGLKDQVLALEWVKEHIRSFGGDPGRVTLAGHSAGAGAVHLHMMSPLSAGLFSQGISGSGCGRDPWAISTLESSRKDTLSVAEVLDCSMEAVLQCFRSADAELLINASITAKLLPSSAVLRPTLEEEGPDAFITTELWNTNTSLPWFVSRTSAEGLLAYSEACKRHDRKLSDFNQHYQEYMPEYFAYTRNINKDILSNKIKRRYFKSENISDHNVKNFVDMMGDGLFTTGWYAASDRHVGTLFELQFNYSGQYSFSNFSGIRNLKLGANHIDDMLYLFHVKKWFPNLVFNEKDRDLSSWLVSLWTTFTTTSSPDATWPKDRSALVIDDLIHPGKKRDEDLNSFWQEIWAGVFPVRSPEL